MAEQAPDASWRPTYAPRNGIPAHLFVPPTGLDKDDRWRPPVLMACNEGCKEKTLLNYKDPVRCRQCGSRILYKVPHKAETRQFEAR
jgi:DNA-directed RNA polymerase subunit RPC12/RpoP